MIRDEDHGYKALIKKLAGAGAEMTVGIHSDADGEVLRYGTINEFGLGVPERSYLRSWFDSNKDKVLSSIHNQLTAWIKPGNKTSILVPLQRAGLEAAAGVKAGIAAGISPENAPSTLAQKNSTTPLIDTNALIGSIVSKAKAT